MVVLGAEKVSVLSTSVTASRVMFAGDRLSTTG
jgi:hypothetical protein